MNIARFGFYIFLIALASAPVLGGTPVGYEYAGAAWGGDGMLGVLRALVFLSALLTAFDPRPAAAGMGARLAARLCVGGTAVWVALSVFVHSRVFQSPIYLFAMLPDALNWLTFATAFALAARFAGESAANVRMMATALLVGGVICAVIGILDFGAQPIATRAAFRESATFFSPNFAAGFAALTLPLAAALFLSAETLLPLAACGAASGVLFALLMMTGSRAGLALALGGLALALTLALVRRAPLVWARVGALVAVLALFGFLFRAPMLGRVTPDAGTAAAAPGDDHSDHSGAFRKETWRGSFAMAKAYPAFGAGPGTFAYTYPHFALIGFTAQAHSSYLQLASESGFVALALALAGVGAGLWAGITAKGGTPTKGDDAGETLLRSALIGGIVAALGRGVFDSEWILLGCGVPFFAVLGMLTALPSAANTPPRPASARVIAAVFCAACLVLTLILRAGQSERDRLMPLARTDPDRAVQEAKIAARRALPADPQLYSLARDFDTAAFLSPSGRRWYQAAKSAEARGDDARAVELFQQSVAADPNNLQTRKALAEAQTKSGDAAGALFTYADMARIAEGPAGKIRAIPELTDTLPAFAYTALAEDAAKSGDTDGALKNFTAARTIIEDYSRTAPVYQVSEALTLGGNTQARRAEVRTLYTGRIQPGLRAALKKRGDTAGAAALATAEHDTLARLDAFVDPASGASLPPP